MTATASTVAQTIKEPELDDLISEFLEKISKGDTYASRSTYLRVIAEMTLCVNFLLNGHIPDERRKITFERVTRAKLNLCNSWSPTIVIRSIINQLEQLIQKLQPAAEKRGIPSLIHCPNCNKNVTPTTIRCCPDCGVTLNSAMDS